MPEIIYESNCKECEEHRTEKGVLLSLWKSIEEMFPAWSIEAQQHLLECWFIQHKLDERTDTIQGFKRTNIKEISKNDRR